MAEEQEKIFKLDEIETKAAEEFIKKHNHKEQLRKAGKLGFSTPGRQISYSFAPTGIGTKVVIQCDLCGKTKDITNYDNW